MKEILLALVKRVLFVCSVCALVTLYFTYESLWVSPAVAEMVHDGFGIMWIFACLMLIYYSVRNICRMIWGKERTQLRRVDILINTVITLFCVAFVWFRLDFKRVVEQLVDCL